MSLAPDNLFGVLVETIIRAYIYVLLLRFILQLVRANFYNPILQFIVKVTNPPLHILRWLLPPFRNFDLASVLLAYVLAMLLAVFSDSASALSINLPYIFLDAAVLEAQLVLNIYFYTTIALAISSWIAPHSNHPVFELLREIAEPILRRIRLVVPAIGGLDLSVLFVLLGIYIIESLIIPTVVSIFI